MSEATSLLNCGDFIWANRKGERVLVKERGVVDSDIFEYEIVEVSPTGLRVKFRNGAGRTFWTDHKQYFIVELLS